MKKCLGFIFLITACLSIQAQEVVYWFDFQTERHNSTWTEQGIQVDVSSLPVGAHCLYAQMIDSAGILTPPYSTIFMKTNDTEVVFDKVVYWFDSQTERRTTDWTGNNLLLDASGLTNGIHLLHAQIVGTNGELTPSISTVFMKTNDTEVAFDKVVYWFDSQTERRTTDWTENNLLLDVSGLTNGIHLLHAQIVGDHGELTPSTSSMFTKLDNDDYHFDKITYWFDSQTERYTTDWDNNTFMVDLSSQSKGIHLLHAQLSNDQGELSPTVSTMISNLQEDAAALAIDKLVYWFDNATSSVYSQSYSGSPVLLDMPNLSPGVHVLYTSLQLANQELVPTQSAVFVVQSPEESQPSYMQSITYYLNDSTETYQRIETPKESESWHYISLLKMPVMPLRSSNFKFVIASDSTFHCYAVNDVHFSFIDTKRYFKDTTVSYVDYNVGEQITQFIPLTSDIRNTQPTPKTNQVLWYSFYLHAGDSATFVSNNACTMEVFSPTAQPVWKSEGKQSKIIRGFHAYETGTYYLALHDALAGSYSKTNVDFRRFDRYAILKQDIRTIGNGGLSTIHYIGNGYNELQSVEYIMGLDTLRAFHIGHESNSETSIVIDATGARKGVYTAVFHFLEEDRIAKKNITMEDAVPIDLEYVQPKDFKFVSGRTSDFHLHIINKGNMTAYAVPIILHTEADGANVIKSITIKGLGQAPFSDYITQGEALTQDEYAQLLKEAQQLDDSHNMLGYKGAGLHGKDSTYQRQGVFYTEIQPYEDREIIVYIQATDSIYLTMVGPTGVPSVTPYPNKLSPAQQAARAARQKTYCDYKDRVECVTAVISDVAALADLATDIVPALKQYAVATSVASCAADIINNTVTSINNIMCGEDTPQTDFQSAWEQYSRDMTFFSICGTVYSCISTTISDLSPWKVLKEALSSVGKCSSTASLTASLKNDFNACKEAFKTNNDAVIEAQAIAVAPKDPNEIYGYTAASGSLYVSDTTEVLYYTIECENDPKFATAPAQVIVITDSLDKEKVDINTLATTKVQLGDNILMIDNEHEFTYTIDMRPQLDVIAQVAQTVDSAAGVVSWTISSLDPLTLDPITNPDLGVLPVNNDGNGIGRVTYTIRRNPMLEDGCQISNRAWIVFDEEEPIITPVWTNTLDIVSPVSQLSAYQENDSLHFIFDANDARSGIWYYSLYGREQAGQLWTNIAERIDETEYQYDMSLHPYQQFMVLAVDSAGNVELEKQAADYSLIPNITTEMDAQVQEDGQRKYLYKGHLYIRRKGKTYDAQGQMVE